MTVSEAQIIAREFYQKNGNYTEEDFFLFTEAMEYLIHETEDPDVMLDLGAAYYRRKEFDLALKYYEMAADAGSEQARINLGYIWYYGRTGRTDYEKAFHYFSSAEGPVAKYKIADMYHRGYYVEKDEAKYKNIIEKLYKEYGGSDLPFDPVPEICTRLAGIRANDGDTDEAVSLLLKGKEVLAERIECEPFFGDLSIMRGLIRDLYRLTEPDFKNLDLYDLYEVLKKPAAVTFTYRGKVYTVESSDEDDGTVAIRFQGKWYRDFTDLLMRANLDDERVTSAYSELKDFTVKA